MIRRRPVEPPRGATNREPEGPSKWSVWWDALQIPPRFWLVSAIVVMVAATLWLGNRFYQTWPLTELVLVGEFDVVAPDQLAESLVWVHEHSFFGLDVAAVQQQVMQQPLIAGAMVRKRWPGTLEVMVHEEVPLAIWNAEQLVTASGRVAPVPRHFDSSKLMTLYGDERALAESVNYFRRFQQLLQGREVRLQSLQVTAVQSVEARLSNGWVVKMGRQYFEQRLQRLMMLLDKLDQSIVQQVDLRYGRGAAIRWKTEGVTG